MSSNLLTKIRTIKIIMGDFNRRGINRNNYTANAKGQKLFDLANELLLVLTQHIMQHTTIQCSIYLTSYSLQIKLSLDKLTC
jgi:hypothetical protein